ncbi:MAG TPA: NAD(P)-dependent oxidoreductase, partial [Stellaceae bacterium]|nr:NAD(P)-dependent oxidoreductase [Stellaceae bacterium]
MTQGAIATPKRIGIVGLGAMGRPMARHLLAKGFSVAGSDLSGAARDAAASLGVSIAPNPKALAAASDAVLVVVGFDAEIERVVFGADGVAAAARPGLILAIGSTIAPSYARRLAERLAGSGLILIDMALTRGEPFAETGTMLILGGGDACAFEACRPVFSAFASDIFNLGPFGAGQVGKMVNNSILWACMAANDEGLRLGEALGVDQETMRAALVHSSAENFALSARADARPTPWAEKDMAIVLKEADGAGMSLPLAGLVREQIKDFKRRKGYPTPKAGE